jgi:hypothetical protein
MFEELAKVAIRCGEHETFNTKCSTCHNVAGVREDMTALKKRRDEIVRRLKGLLTEKKVVIVDLR